MCTGTYDAVHPQEKYLGNSYFRKNMAASPAHLLYEKYHPFRYTIRLRPFSPDTVSRVSDIMN
jgi:hypothetical protein